MNQLKSLVLVLCLACFSAGTLLHLFPDSSAKRCIKAVAGLYILVAVLQGVRVGGVSQPLQLLQSQELPATISTSVIEMLRVPSVAEHVARKQEPVYVAESASENSAVDTEKAFLTDEFQSQILQDSANTLSARVQTALSQENIHATVAITLQANPITSEISISRVCICSEEAFSQGWQESICEIVNITLQSDNQIVFQCTQDATEGGGQ